MKHQTGNKILASIIVIALLFAMMALPASAEEYDAAGATRFVFSDSGITVSEGSYSGYKIDGTALTLNGSGTYVVSGSCSDGSIKVKKGTTDVVLVLNGLTLTSSDTAPITCNKSTAVTIVAAAGSVNTLTDNAYNNDDDYPDNTNAENAVIKCKDGSQVTVCGSGTINVIANGKNGVKGGMSTEDDGESWLTIKELTLNITANVNDGLKADQELNILSGNVTVSAADDGIKSDYVLNIGEQGTEGPAILVSQSNEGIEAATVNIYSGSITVHSSDDGINAGNSDLSGYSFSCNIYGGTLCVDASGGDGIDSNGTLTLAGGNVQVFSSSQNDNSPLDSDGTFTLSGGTVLAIGSAGMPQTPSSATQPYLSFGAVGGMGGMPGQGGMGNMRNQSPMPGQGEMGNMRKQHTMPGQGGMEGAPEMGGQPGVNEPGFGGPAGMNAAGSTVSISAGDTVSILDGSGQTLCSAVSTRSAAYVFFSSAALSEGESYTLAVNGSSAATTEAGSEGSKMGGFPGNQEPTETKTPSGSQMPSGGATAPGGQMPSASQTNTDVSAAKTFSDVPENAWCYSFVTKLSEAGVIDGMGNGSFDPNGTLTWAQAMKLLLCAHGDLTDVTGSTWASTAMRKAAELGLYEVSPDGSAKISRLDFCTAAAKLFEVSGTTDAFSDCDKPAVLALHSAGIVNGYPDGSFGPDRTLSRAEISKIIYLLMQY